MYGVSFDEESVGSGEKDCAFEGTLIGRGWQRIVHEIGQDRIAGDAHRTKKVRRDGGAIRSVVLVEKVLSDGRLGADAVKAAAGTRCCIQHVVARDGIVRDLRVAQIQVNAAAFGGAVRPEGIANRVGADDVVGDDGRADFALNTSA